MKFSASLAVAGAAVASAAAVPVENVIETPVDYCPVVVKTIGLSWIELEQFVPAEEWTVEKAESCISKSKPDPAQVWHNLANYTSNVGQDNNGNGTATYPGGSVPINDEYPSGDSYPTDGAYPTGGGYPTGGAHPTASYSASVQAPYPTGYANFSSSYPVGPTGGAYSSQSASGLYSSGSASASSSASSSSAASQTIAAGRSSSSVSSSAATTSSAASRPTGCTTPRVRIEWRNANDRQRDAFVAGIRCLMEKPSSNPARFPGSRSLYEDLSSLHQQVVGQVHQSGKFLVFHRFYISIFERLLRNQCSYNGPMIWWDEEKDAGAFDKAPMCTKRWFGEMPAAINGRGVCVESGFGSYEPNIGPSGAINNPHCLSRAVNEQTTQYVGKRAVDSCRNAQNYNDFRECAEMTYHAYGHNGVGSVMSNVATSPCDPLFYLHHFFIDRNYRQWQNLGKTRNYEIGGPSSHSDSTPVKPTDKLPAYGLVPDVTIADVLNTENNYLCYRYDDE